MIARFAAEATAENLARADAWADAAIGALLPRIYQGFGAIQLMVRYNSVSTHIDAKQSIFHLVKINTDAVIRLSY